MGNQRQHILLGLIVLVGVAGAIASVVRDTQQFEVLPIADDAMIESFGAELAEQLVLPVPDMDLDAVVAREQFAVRGLSTIGDPEKQAALVRGVVRSRVPQILAQVHQRVIAGDNLKYLGTAVHGEHKVVRFRLIAEQGGVEFFDLLIGVQRGLPVVVDSFSLNTGQWHSDAHAELLEASRGVNGRSARQVRALGEAAHAGRHEEVLQLFHALPASARELRSVWLHRVNAAAVTDDVERHMSILDEYKARFPDDPAAHILFFDAHFIREQWEEATADLDALEASFPDAFWTAMRASIAIEQDDYVGALELAEDVIRADPTLIEGPESGLVASLALGEMERANRFATSLREDFDLDLSLLAPEPGYEALVDLPAYTQP